MFLSLCLSHVCRLLCFASGAARSPDLIDGARRMKVLGIDSSTPCVAVAATDGGEPVREPPSARTRTAGRATRSCCWREVEACGRRAGGWERDRADRGRGRAGLLHRACGSGSPPRARSRRPGRCRSPGSATPRRARAPGSRELARGRGPPRAAGARRPPRPGLRGAPRRRTARPVWRAARRWTRRSSRDAGRGAGHPGACWRPGTARYDFVAQLEAAGADVAAPGDAVHRVAARHICALGEGGGRGAAGADRADLSESSPMQSDGLTDDMTEMRPAESSDPQAPPAHLRRPALGDRDRAPLVPDAVVAGDVRARALEADGHLPRGRGRERPGRLPGLLALRRRSGT